MKYKNKSFITVGIVATGILIVVLILLYRKHVHFRSPVIFLPDPQHVVTGDKARGFQENKAVLENSQAYSSKVMQFDDNCVASPITLTAKVGDSVMFENRSNYQRTIGVGDQTYMITPYGHIVLSFGAIDSYQISCDSFRKVGLIGIQ